MLAFASCSVLTGALEPAIAAYALRLSQTFGVRRVGWSLFTAFFLLALLHLVQSTVPAGIASGAVTSVGSFVVLLLLVGMAHTEASLAERLRTERRERALREGLEACKAEITELQATCEDLRAQGALRARTVKLLEESERQYRALFTEHPQPMWIFDLDSFRILAVNQAALRAWGLTRQQFMGMTAKDLRPPEDAPAFENEVRQPAAAAALPRAARFCMHDHTVFEAETIFFDQEFDRRRARLVIVYDLRQNQLADQSVSQAEKLEATGRLARGIAHHFNNLITPVLGHTTVLLERVHEEDCVEQLKQIATAATQIAALTRRLQVLGRGAPIRNEWLDLGDLVGELDGSIRHLMGDSIILRKTRAPYLPPIRGDAALVQQVIMSLVVNAREAMGGFGSLHISSSAVVITQDHLVCNPQARPGEYACLTIRDTGSGMTPHVRAHLFEPFFTTKEVGKGTGLDLAAAYHVVKQHNGWIDVTTGLGAGTEFRLFFPSALPA